MKSSRRLSAAVLTSIASVFLVLAYNFRFWNVFIEATGGIGWANAPLQIAAFVILALTFNALLILVTLPRIIKPVLIVLFLATSFASYWKRYPKQFGKWGPVCATDSIVAAYDNTILYTDHFVSRTIDLLRQGATEDGVDTSLIYFSDHGESLGEKNIYLHGAPYMIAPEEQRRVPFMVWISDGFRHRFRIDTKCLAARTGQAFSHDNVFHSTLGMLNVSTAVYNPGLDIFQACHVAGQSKVARSEE